MSEHLEHLTACFNAALDRYLALQGAAEQASDRGGRGPTPIEIAEARLDAQVLRARAVRARDAIGRPNIHGRVA